MPIAFEAALPRVARVSRRARFGSELRIGYDAVHKPEGLRSRGVDRVAREEHLERVLSSHGAGKRHARGRAKPAAATARHGELRGSCGNREVAARHELAARRSGKTLDLRDHHLRHRGKRLHQLGAHSEKPPHSRKVAPVHVRKVMTGGEDGPFGRDDDAARFALGDLTERVEELAQMLLGQGVAPLRALHGDAGKGVLVRDGNVSVLHAGPPSLPLPRYRR